MLPRPERVMDEPSVCVRDGLGAHVAVLAAARATKSAPIHFVKVCLLYSPKRRHGQNHDIVNKFGLASVA